jgi:hypothetical protein
MFKTNLQQATTHVLTSSEYVNGERGTVREANVVLVASRDSAEV